MKLWLYSEVKSNRPLPPYFSLEKIIVQLKCQNIVILVAFSLSEEVQTASLKTFIHTCRAVESMFLLAWKTWSGFLQSQGSLTVSGTSCQFLLKQGFTSKSQPQIKTQFSAGSPRAWSPLLNMALVTA